MLSQILVKLKDFWTELQIDLGLIKQPPTLLQPIKIEEHKLRKINRRK